MQLLGVQPSALLEALTHRKIEAKTEEVTMALRGNAPVVPSTVWVAPGQADPRTLPTWPHTAQLLPVSPALTSSFPSIAPSLALRASQSPGLPSMASLHVLFPLLEHSSLFRLADSLSLSSQGHFLKEPSLFTSPSPTASYVSSYSTCHSQLKSNMTPLWDLLNVSPPPQM